MDTNQAAKKAKSGKHSVYISIRIRRETRKRLLTELAKANKKDFGKKVRMDEYIALALSLIKPEHIESLQESSLTHADRFERDYRTYIA